MIEYSDAANDAIEEIEYIGIRDFGLAQAEKFKQSLYKTIEFAAQFPESGRDCGHIRPGLRRAVFAPYLIFYERTVQGIRIINILHGRSNPARHVP